MTGDVSWMEIREGWSVLTSEGERVGVVVQTDGDREKGVFAGVGFETGNPAELRYVRNDQVAQISSGSVTLTIASEDAAALRPFQAPKSDAELLADRSYPRRIWGWLRS